MLKPFIWTYHLLMFSPKKRKNVYRDKVMLAEYLLYTGEVGYWVVEFNSGRLNSKKEFIKDLKGLCDTQADWGKYFKVFESTVNQYSKPSYMRQDTLSYLNPISNDRMCYAVIAASSEGVATLTGYQLHGGYSNSAIGLYMSLHPRLQREVVNDYLLDDTGDCRVCGEEEMLDTATGECDECDTHGLNNITFDQFEALLIKSKEYGEKYGGVD